MAREEDHLGLGMLRFDAPDHLQPAQAGHLHVQDDHVAGTCLQEVQGLAAPRHAPGLEAAELQALLQGAHQLLFVVHDEHA